MKYSEFMKNCVSVLFEHYDLQTYKSICDLVDKNNMESTDGDWRSEFHLFFCSFLSLVIWLFVIIFRSVPLPCLALPSISFHFVWLETLQRHECSKFKCRKTISSWLFICAGFFFILLSFRFSVSLLFFYFSFRFVSFRKHASILKCSPNRGSRKWAHALNKYAQEN